MSIDLNERFDLTMIVTYQNQDHISDFLTSINLNRSIKLFVILLNQETTFRFDQNTFNNKVMTIDMPKSGLSKARNNGIEYLKRNDVKCEYIMFPDDDSTFDDALFLNFTKIKGSGKNFLTPIYIAGSQKLYLGKPCEEDRQIKENDHSLIGSPNQLINFERNKKDLLFNEQLGAGTPLGSCEDYDLFLRLSRNGEYYHFTNKLYNYHPKKTDAYKGIDLQIILRRFKSYSSGFCFIIFKYQKYGFIPNYLFRTLAASAYFILKLNFKLSTAYLVQFFYRLTLIIMFSSGLLYSSEGNSAKLTAR